MSEINLKDLEYSKHKGKRNVDVTISLFNTWSRIGNPQIEYSLTIRLVESGLDDYICILTANHILDLGLSGNDAEIIRFIKGLSSIKALTNAYLKRLPMNAAVHQLYNELIILSLDYNEYSIYCYRYPVLLLHKFDTVLSIRNKHHYLPIILNIINGQGIDFKRRTAIQVFNLLTDILLTLGLNPNYFATEEEGQIINIETTTRSIQHTSYLTMTEEILKRKAKTGFFFTTKLEIKRKIGKEFAKRILLDRRGDLRVIIDDTSFEILDAEVK